MTQHEPKKSVAPKQSKGSPPKPYDQNPEFYFDKDGKLWFAHECKLMKPEEGTFLREWSLPPAIYEIVTREPLNVWPPVACSLCGLKGVIKNGEWETFERKRETPTSD